MRITSMLVLMVFAASWHGTAAAGSTDLSSLACGKHAIELGMSPQDIKTTCGKNWKPSYISKHKRPAIGADDGSNDLFEKWMYKASGKKDTHVVIKNGEVVRIFTVR